MYGSEQKNADTDNRTTQRPLNAYQRELIARTGRCQDCGKRGELTGHQDCQFPQDH